MFGKRQARDDANDFFKMSAGQLLALFKKVGGKAGAEQILQGHGALTELAPEIRVLKSLECKVGLPVVSSFYGMLTSYLEPGKSYMSRELMTEWATDILANTSLQSVQVDLCVATFEELTGITNKPDLLGLDELLRVVRYPYQPIPIELLPQIAYQYKGLSPIIETSQILPMEPGAIKNLWDLPMDWIYSFGNFHTEDDRHVMEILPWETKDKRFRSWSRSDRYVVMRSSQPFVL